MTRFALIAAAALVLPAGAHAAVSGFHDSAEQITTILASTEVADALRQLPVDSIEFEGTQTDGSLRWEVEVRGCDVDVVLTPKPPAGVGKTTYEVNRVSRCR